MKNTKVYVGISMIVQAFSCLIMFFILCTKKKSIASAFLAVAAMNGVAGAYLLYQHRLEQKGEESDSSDCFLDEDGFDFDCSMINSDIYGSDNGSVTFDIPTDEDATEADFQ